MMNVLSSQRSSVPVVHTAVTRKPSDVALFVSGLRPASLASPPPPHQQEESATRVPQDPATPNRGVRHATATTTNYSLHSGGEGGCILCVGRRRAPGDSLSSSLKPPSSIGAGRDDNTNNNNNNTASRASSRHAVVEEEEHYVLEHVLPSGVRLAEGHLELKARESLQQVASRTLFISTTARAAAASSRQGAAQRFISGAIRRRGGGGLTASSLQECAAALPVVVARVRHHRGGGGGDDGAADWESLRFWRGHQCVAVHRKPLRLPHAEGIFEKTGGSDGGSGGGRVSGLLRWGRGRSAEDADAMIWSPAEAEAALPTHARDTLLCVAWEEEARVGGGRPPSPPPAGAGGSLQYLGALYLSSACQVTLVALFSSSSFTTATTTTSANNNAVCFTAGLGHSHPVFCTGQLTAECVVPRGASLASHGMTFLAGAPPAASPHPHGGVAGGTTIGTVFLKPHAIAFVMLRRRSQREVNEEAAAAVTLESIPKESSSGATTTAARRGALMFGEAYELVLSASISLPNPPRALTSPADSVVRMLWSGPNVLWLLYRSHAIHVYYVADTAGGAREEGARGGSSNRGRAIFLHAFHLGVCCGAGGDEGVAHIRVVMNSYLPQRTQTATIARTADDVEKDKEGGAHGVWAENTSTRKDFFFGGVVVAVHSSRTGSLMAGTLSVRGRPTASSSSALLSSMTLGGGGGAEDVSAYISPEQRLWEVCAYFPDILSDVSAQSSGQIDILRRTREGNNVVLMTATPPPPDNHTAAAGEAAAQGNNNNDNSVNDCIGEVEYLRQRCEELFVHGELRYVAKKISSLDDVDAALHCIREVERCGDGMRVYANKAAMLRRWEADTTTTHSNNNSNNNAIPSEGECKRRTVNRGVTVKAESSFLCWLNGELAACRSQVALLRWILLLDRGLKESMEGSRCSSSSSSIINTLRVTPLLTLADKLRRHRTTPSLPSDPCGDILSWILEHQGNFEYSHNNNNNNDNSSRNIAQLVSMRHAEEEQKSVIHILLAEIQRRIASQKQRRHPSTRFPLTTTTNNNNNNGDDDRTAWAHATSLSGVTLCDVIHSGSALFASYESTGTSSRAEEEGGNAEMPLEVVLLVLYAVQASFYANTMEEEEEGEEEEGGSRSPAPRLGRDDVLKQLVIFWTQEQVGRLIAPTTPAASPLLLRSWLDVFQQPLLTAHTAFLMFATDAGVTPAELVSLLPPPPPPSAKPVIFRSRSRSASRRTAQRVGGEEEEDEKEDEEHPSQQQREEVQQQRLRGHLLTWLRLSPHTLPVSRQCRSFLLSRLLRLHWLGSDAGMMLRQAALLLRNQGTNRRDMQHIEEAEGMFVRRLLGPVLGLTPLPPSRAEEATQGYQRLLETACLSLPSFSRFADHRRDASHDGADGVSAAKAQALLLCVRRAALGLISSGEEEEETRHRSGVSFPPPLLRVPSRPNLTGLVRLRLTTSTPLSTTTTTSSIKRSGGGDYHSYWYDDAGLRYLEKMLYFALPEHGKAGDGGGVFSPQRYRRLQWQLELYCVSRRYGAALRVCNEMLRQGASTSRQHQSGGGGRGGGGQDRLYTVKSLLRSLLPRDTPKGGETEEGEMAPGVVYITKSIARPPIVATSSFMRGGKEGVDFCEAYEESILERGAGEMPQRRKRLRPPAPEMEEVVGHARQMSDVKGAASSVVHPAPSSSYGTSLPSRHTLPVYHPPLLSSLSSAIRTSSASVPTQGSHNASRLAGRGEEEEEEECGMAVRQRLVPSAVIDGL